MNDIDKYVLEQAKIEVEHNRSWPTKVLAFYVAINAGVVTALSPLNGWISANAPWQYPLKAIVTIALLVLWWWASYLLQKNHRNYLEYRNIQIRFQQTNREEIEKRFPVRPEWFTDIEIRSTSRWQGWGFYLSIVVIVAVLGISGVWV